MKKILVVGSANMDLVMGVKDIPVVGETALCHSFQKVPGGKGANQAYACARLGGDTVFLSALGGDDLGDALLENLRQAGVDTSAIRRTADAATGMAVVCVSQRGDNAILVVPGANQRCDVEYLQQNRDLFLHSDIVLLQMEIPSESVFYAVRLARELGKTVILNPAPAPEGLPEDIYGALDLITPNETEFKQLTGCPTDQVEDILLYSRRILDKGTKHVLVTLGSRGALFIGPEGHRLFPAVKVTAVDTTAAGDTFNGALARKLADGCGYEQAIVFANHASALSVSRPGAQTSIPSYEEVTAFMRERGTGD